MRGQGILCRKAPRQRPRIKFTTLGTSTTINSITKRTYLISEVFLILLLMARTPSLLSIKLTRRIIPNKKLHTHFSTTVPMDGLAAVGGMSTVPMDGLATVGGMSTANHKVP